LRAFELPGQDQAGKFTGALYGLGNSFFSRNLLDNISGIIEYIFGASKTLIKLEALNAGVFALESLQSLRVRPSVGANTLVIVTGNNDFALVLGYRFDYLDIFGI
jgi:hypothetical protein